MVKMFKAAHLASVAGAAISLAAFQPAFAQTTQATQTTQDEIASATDTVVITGIGYRDRTNETAPVLVYGADYIQPFEPLTVGDALKRVPSVTFLSDVLESDGVRLRGLDPAYTQILINGEKVPGSGADSGAFGNGSDGSFFVDRIPAELIDSIEIVRSASANRSGDAMAGAVNIVLKDAYSLDGGYIRLGALGFDDGRVRETYGAVWGGEVGGGRLLLGANVQGRRNPKEKLSLRFDNPADTTANTVEDQSDTRDGTDYSANFSYQIEAGPGELTLNGFFVQTDRFADEDSFEYTALPAPSTVTGLNRSNTNLFTINSNDVDTEQSSWAFSGGYEFDSFGGETLVKLGYARFDNSESEFENETEYLRGSEFSAIPAANRIYPEADRFTRDLARVDLNDTEFSARAEHTREIGFGEIEFGLQYESKERDNLVSEGRFRTGSGGVLALAQGAIIPDASGSGVPGYRDPATAAIPGGNNSIERTQIAPFAVLSGESGAMSWEAGLRYESTELDVNDRTAAPALQNTSSDYGVFLPSAHLRWDLTDSDRVSTSLARTIRNPSFNFLSPAVLPAELGDNDFRGDPTLEPETAWGLDLGYEKRLGRTGIAGINFFYRDVKDLIELDTVKIPGTNNPAVGSGGAGTFIYAPVNSGDGKVWGIELDYSASLDFVGLPDTGAFFNYSWLDSDVDDLFGSRRFNSQSDFVYNIGFIHDITAWDASFGVTYRKQGDAFSRVVGEEVTTSYEGVLEVFVEKTIGDNFTVRLTGGNLTDGSKDEVFDKFDTFADQVGRSYAEYELETETAGPTWQLIGRYSF